MSRSRELITPLLLSQLASHHCSSSDLGSSRVAWMPTGSHNCPTDWWLSPRLPMDPSCSDIKCLLMSPWHSAFVMTGLHICHMNVIAQLVPWKLCVYTINLHKNNPAQVWRSERDHHTTAWDTIGNYWPWKRQSRVSSEMGLVCIELSCHGLSTFHRTWKWRWLILCEWV